MIAALDFEHEGKKYTCTVEKPKKGKGSGWWWFQVSGDTHRYAPFHAASSDTKASVQSRIIEYYATHMAARAAPPPQRGHWSRRGQQNGAAAKAPAAAASGSKVKK